LAGTKIAICLSSNGQAIGQGTTAGQTVATTVNGQTVNIPISQSNVSGGGDAGGTNNGGGLLLYTPPGGGALPTPSTLGTFNTTNGNFLLPAFGGNQGASLASLYLTALTFLGYDVTTATSMMVASGAISSAPALLIS
jgi:hypothetical protein